MRVTVDPTDRPHPILEDPHTWAVVGLAWRSVSDTSWHSDLDLVLRRGDEQRALRFFEVSELRVDDIGPTSSTGIESHDVSARGMFHRGIHVADLEHDSLSFWAWKAEEVPIESFGHPPRLD